MIFMTVFREARLPDIDRRSPCEGCSS